MAELLQGTTEWHRERLGKISASEVYLLLKDRKEPMTVEELAEFRKENPKSRVTTKIVPFSDATFTYLDSKVMESLLPINSDRQEDINIVNDYIEQHDVANRAMNHGHYWEDEARKRYAQVMGYEVIEVGFVPYEKYPDYAGASPDGLLREVKGGLEIKSPFTLEKHLQHFLYQTQDDLKENEPQYYWQCVMGMLDTGCEFWDFVSFCPYIEYSKQLKVLRIHRRQDEMDLLDERIGLGVKYIQDKRFQLDITQTIIK